MPTNEIEQRARRAGLRLTAPDRLVLERRPHGRGFVYLDERGARITDRAVLTRLRGLVIPPAYREVRIARHERDHIQAVGRDEAGRLQYLYHPDWEQVREEGKVGRLAALCAALPRIRRRVARMLDAEELSRERTLAAVVRLIDATHIRIGCEDYVHSGRSRGATTLLKRNVRLDGDRVDLAFRGKSGRAIRCGLTDAALAATLVELRRLPGPRLFKYRTSQGELRTVDAAETNAWLREAARAPVTAKDFRTLAATAAAAERLAAHEPAASPTARRRQIAPVMREVAEMLGNTPAVARRSYVHRRLVDAFEAGELASLRATLSRPRLMSPGEALVTALFGEEG